MIRTQVELPDELHAEVRRVARERGISMSEVIRRGLQHMTEQVYPPLPKRLARKTAALRSGPRHRR